MKGIIGIMCVELVAEAVIKIIKKPIRKFLPISRIIGPGEKHCRRSPRKRFLHKTLIDGFI